MECEFTRHDKTIGKSMLLSLLFASLCLAPLGAQATVGARLRVAVFPFESFGLEASEAAVIHGLFETSLANAGVFTVVEQGRLEAVLEAQELSYMAFADEAGAVELGRVLSAEAIVLSQLSLLENRYILVAKLIDVRTAENLRSGSLITSTLAELIGRQAALAGTIAGSTRAGSALALPAQFQDVFISSEPAGAQIFVNGRPSGAAPGVVEDIPYGEVFIEARWDLGSLFKVVVVNASITTLAFNSRDIVGSLMIRSDASDADVYLDGNRLGPLGQGYFATVPGGRHLLELRSPVARWSGEINLRQGETLRIEAAVRPDRSQIASNIGLRFQSVVPRAGGSYSMGSPSGGSTDERPVHPVSLTIPLSFAVTEVTNAQVAAVFNQAVLDGLAEWSGTILRNREGSQQTLLNLREQWIQLRLENGRLVVLGGFENYPCVGVTWYGAMAFCRFLNVFENRQQAVDFTNWSCRYSGGGYRLPTEAEWEYAARDAASIGLVPYSGGAVITDVGWSSRNAATAPNSAFDPQRGGTHAVALLLPNALGLYDMTGNALEWCLDWYDARWYQSSPRENPTGAATGRTRVVRGGGWLNLDDSCRVTYRDAGDPAAVNNQAGFRVVRGD